MKGVIKVEKWVDIENFEGYYQISDKRRVRSLDRVILRRDGVLQSKPGCIKKPKINDDGYHTITLSKNNIGKTTGIHILVAKHFIPNPDNLPEVNHIDFDRTNNCVENLEWCTHRENVQYSAANGRYKIRDYYKENNPNYGNHVLSEIYRNDPDLAKEKLARPGKQNGRACPLKLYDQNHVFIKSFDYIGECAQYLIENNYTKGKPNCVQNNIGRAIKNGKNI